MNFCFILTSNINYNMWWTIVPREIITKTWIMGLSIWNYHGIVIVFGWTNLHVVRSCWLDGLADNSALHIISHRKLGNVALSLPRHRVDAVYLQADELLSPSERFLTRRSHADSQQGPIRWYIKFTASHALSSSCHRWVFRAMQRRASVANGDADERKISWISSEESLSPDS